MRHFASGTQHSRLTISEVFGIYPPREKFAEARRALLGDGQTPKSKFGLSSLKFFNSLLIY
jgi:hypothetical protein